MISCSQCYCCQTQCLGSVAKIVHDIFIHRSNSYSMLVLHLLFENSCFDFFEARTVMLRVISSYCQVQRTRLNYNSIRLILGGPDVMTNRMWDIVDVRDVVNALLLLYEKNESSRRYICSPNCICTRDLVDMLKKMYPKYNYVNKSVFCCLPDQNTLVVHIIYLRNLMSITLLLQHH